MIFYSYVSDLVESAIRTALAIWLLQVMVVCLYGIVWSVRRLRASDTARARRDNRLQDAWIDGCGGCLETQHAQPHTNARPTRKNDTSGSCAPSHDSQGTD